MIDEILQPNYAISYEDKGNVVTKVVSERIFDAAKLDEDSARIILATGNDNLRPDRLIKYLMEKHGLQGDYGIVKVRAFVDTVDADEYLSDLQQ